MKRKFLFAALFGLEILLVSSGAFLMIQGNILGETTRGVAAAMIIFGIILMVISPVLKSKILNQPNIYGS